MIQNCKNAGASAAPSVKDDWQCMGAYFNYNGIDEIDVQNIGKGYKLIASGYRGNYYELPSTERHFLIKLKHKVSEASLIIEAS